MRWLKRKIWLWGLEGERADSIGDGHESSPLDAASWSLGPTQHLLKTRAICTRCRNLVGTREVDHNPVGKATLAGKVYDMQDMYDIPAASSWLLPLMNNKEQNGHKTTSDSFFLD